MSNSRKSTSRRRRQPLAVPRGERHCHAWLTDHDVELIRALREGDPPLSFAEIAAKFERPDGSPAPLSTIKAICWYKRR